MLKKGVYNNRYQFNKNFSWKFWDAKLEFQAAGNGE